MKTHLRETKKNPDDWKQSPHIFNALTQGTYAACNAGCCDSAHITDIPDEVTCKACMDILSNEKVSDSPPLASNNTKTANGEFAAPLG
jgi:hypothetical protein